MDKKIHVVPTCGEAGGGVAIATGWAHKSRLEFRLLARRALSDHNAS